MSQKAGRRDSLAGKNCTYGQHTSKNCSNLHKQLKAIRKTSIKKEKEQSISHKV